MQPDVTASYPPQFAGLVLSTNSKGTGYVEGDPVNRYDPLGLFYRVDEILGLAASSSHSISGGASYGGQQAIGGGGVKAKMMADASLGGTEYPLMQAGVLADAQVANSGRVLSPAMVECMKNYANDFSIAGGVQALWNYVRNESSDDIKSNRWISAIAGNAISTFIFGSNQDNADQTVASSPGIVVSAMGSPITYGRRTTDIIALNIAGKGGVPRALGAASATASGVIAKLASVTSLGMSFAQRLALDAALFGALYGYCYYQVSGKP